MRQLLYSSIGTRAAIGDDVATILLQSRRNNAVSGITGLLWTDGLRYVQVIEGSHGSVESLVNRLSVDPRHRAMTILMDDPIEARSFGRWHMALYEGGDHQMHHALREADPLLRDTFAMLIAGASPAGRHHPA